MHRQLFFSYGENVNLQKWQQVNRAMHGMDVSNILRLIDLILAIPPTSVMNERAFSQLKLIKTDRRHRLSQRRLNNILIIKLDGPGILEFQPDEAIDSWMVCIVIEMNSV